MDNNSQPQNGNPDLPPALDQNDQTDQNDQDPLQAQAAANQAQSFQSQPFQGQPMMNTMGQPMSDMSAQPMPGTPAQPGSTMQQTVPQGQPSTGVNLESPILSPTHFDGMQHTPITTQSTKPELTAEQKKLRTYLTLSIVFGVMAAIGIFVGIGSLIFGITTNEKLSAADQIIQDKNAIIKVIEDDTNTTITTPDQVPAYAPVSGNIYISEWGIKITVPEDLQDVSYILDQKYRPQICFNATKKGVKYFPAFADVDQNPGGMGCLTQVGSHEGDSDNSGMSFGQRVFNHGEYNYFYTPPARVFSVDPSEAGLEDTAVQIIRRMLVENVSHYE